MQDNLYKLMIDNTLKYFVYYIIITHSSVVYVIKSTNSVLSF